VPCTGRRVRLPLGPLTCDNFLYQRLQAYIWNGRTYGGRVPQPFILPYTPDTIPSAVGVGGNCIGGGDVPAGLVGAIAEVAVYPRALPVSELLGHYHLLGSRDALS
jgi:hypothetical protein